MNGSPADGPSSAPLNERPPRSRWAALLDAVCRYLAAALFLMAAVTKITAPWEFSDQLTVHSGLPPWLSLSIATVLPWLELTCGFCLLSGWAIREAAVVGAALLLAFTLYLLMVRPETDCGCLLFPGALPPRIHLPALIARNVLALTCCLRLAASSHRHHG